MMILLKKWIAAATVVMMSASVCSAAVNDSVARKERPKVGVVLSGGGAKGSAHIGALKVIEEMGIPVDFVTGTSMGSIIGGLYSLGYTPDEMDSIIRTVDWSIIMSNNVTRKQLSYQDKKRTGKYLLTVPFNTASSLEKSMAAGRGAGRNRSADDASGQSRSDASVFINSLPAGFISGNNVENLLNSLAVGYQDSIDFDDLPIPYACVGTDIVTGNEIVFRSGHLAQAIRASMAIPGVFAPIRIGDMVLVDGGMLNNFPVDICREMGADIIIGVRVSSSKKSDPDMLNSLPEVLSQLMGVVTQRKSDENIAGCDIFIEPDISGFGAMSFDSQSVSTLVQRGYDAADAHREELRELKEMLNGYGSCGRHLQAQPALNLDNDTITVASVSLEGVSPKDGRWLLEKSRLLKKRRMTGHELDDAISLFYGTNAFSKITYYVNRDPVDSTAYHVQINLEKEVPHSFGLGFRFDSQEAAAILLGLGLNEQKLTGVKFNLSTRLSYNPWATVRLSLVPRKFPRFNLSYTFKKTETSILDNGKLFADVYFLRHTAKAYFSEYHSRFMSTEVGVNVEHYDYRHFMGADTLYVDNSGINPLKSAYMGLYGKLDFDNTDRTTFPTKGVDFTLDASWKFLNFIDNQPFTTFADVMLQFNSYIPVFNSRLVVSPQVYSRFIIGDNYYTSYETLMGGEMPGRYVDHQLPFIGTLRPEVMYNSLVILRSDFRVNVYGKHYVTAMVNYAREAADVQNFFRKGRTIDDRDNYNYGYMSAYNWWGVGLRYSYDLPIGPLDVDFGWSDMTNRFTAYVSLGYYF